MHRQLRSNHRSQYTDIEGKDGVDILYGVDANTRAIISFIDRTKHRYDVYADSRTPSFVMDNQGIRAKFFEFKHKKQGYVRYITEIKKENIDYCKQLMKAVDLRHTVGPKGIFRVNETEYQYNAALDESRQVAVIIRSRLKQIVTRQQNVFEKLWNKAVPARDRIREIEDEQQQEQRKKKGEVAATRTKEKPLMVSNAVKTTSPDLIVDVISLQRMKKEELEKPKEISSNRKIQLWSNPSMTEYAIRLDTDSGFLATSPGDKSTATQFTSFLEEVDYFEDLKYDWKYTLKHWINNSYDHEYYTKKADREKIQPLLSQRKNTGSSTATDSGSSNSRIPDNKMNAYGKLSKRKLTEDESDSRYAINSLATHARYNRLLSFKCHYCELKFDNNIRRKKHEQAWHTPK